MYVSLHFAINVYINTVFLHLFIYFIITTQGLTLTIKVHSVGEVDTSDFQCDAEVDNVPRINVELQTVSNAAPIHKSVAVGLVTVVA